ncbi:ABC transporter ATP-binding protein [Puniceicoccales bacterium CK1056]|uniref:ABC transporter ATP-binding protein n=1 Tax=Oceanipulchritudo coccoides TaxID=2706888 RepID=A0A6B2M3I7_9BACT|nr:ABC transporter ATP-binding protein [Oceanipulchritudo coccoides]NDV63518.1 ABC transporter ATP-binding protein [Oceanipulchritudo coccoides]
MTSVDASIKPLLTVESLCVHLGSPRIEAVRGIDFSIQPGEIVGLAGESGSGKSVTALALTRLLPEKAAPAYRGKVSFAGSPDNLLSLGERALRQVRGSGIGYIFQEPSASFNPVFNIRSHMEEVLRLQKVPSRQSSQRIEQAFGEVGIPADSTHLEAWPGDFSGGMLQRTAIACALLAEPGILIADEPTTALDASTQKRIVDLLKRLNRERNMAILFISHDLGLLKDIASRILVMKEGRIVEGGPVGKVLTSPKDPYTRQLLDSLPKLRR